MRAINLLPAEQRAGRKVSLSRSKLVMICGAAVVLGLGYYTWNIKQEVSRVNEAVGTAESDRSAVQAEIATLNASARSETDLQRFQGMVSGIARSRTDWDRVIRDVALVMPRQAWLTTLRAETPKAAAAAPAAAGAGAGAVQIPAPTGVHIEGYTYSHSQVAGVLARLGVVRGLGEPHLASSQPSVIGTRKVIKFTIDASVDQRAQDRPEFTSETSSGATPAGG
jgi:Tfp pilus assembly protein PilN